VQRETGTAPRTVFKRSALRIAAWQDSEVVRGARRTERKVTNKDALSLTLAAPAAPPCCWSRRINLPRDLPAAPFHQQTRPWFSS